MKYMGGWNYEDLKVLPLPYYYEIVKIIDEDNARIEAISAGVGV